MNEDKNVEKINPFDEKQRMLAFAFLADITSGMIYADTTHPKREGLQEEAETLTYTQVTEFLAKKSWLHQDKDLTPFIGEGWVCHSNPWVALATNSRGETLAQNTTLVLSNGDNIVVAVAGTNFIQNYDWFTEDLDVETATPWYKVLATLETSTGLDQSSLPNAGNIANGTFDALKRTWNQAGASSGKNLIDTLKQVIDKKKSVNITVTGHSLGGAITPVLAQALANLSPFHFKGVDIKISAYPFAGPTVGDQDFVHFVENISPEKITLNSTYNVRDVVPHGWKLSMIEEMYGLFWGKDKKDQKLKNAKDDPNGKLVVAIINWIYGKSQQQSGTNAYVRWTTEDKFTGEWPADIEVDGLAARKVIKDRLTRHNDNDATIEAMCKIVGIKYEKGTWPSGLDDYLLYFCKYLVILGNEHIKQYSIAIYKSDTFTGRFKNLAKVTKKVIENNLGIDQKHEKEGDTLASGLLVLQQLFVDVANSPSSASKKEAAAAAEA